jgi:formimidoylglutamate deiminase
VKPTPTQRETGWLPDLVYTGEKFEAGLAFFADALGRISRFSREPADLAAAKRLEGQAALPGLVNAHSRALWRLDRGRIVADTTVVSLRPEEVYDVARMAFMEMLLSGITCVGEFGAPPSGAIEATHALLRAARDVGIRVALFHVGIEPVSFAGEMDALRGYVAREHPGDETWLGVGTPALGAMPMPQLQEIAAYAHAQRLRVHLPVASNPAENAACLAATGRTPVQLLAERGLIDKRLTAIHAVQISDDEARLLGAARALVCACPTSAHWRGVGTTPAGRLLAAGADVSLGSDAQVQINLLEEARRLEPRENGRNVAASRLRAATVAGARSLGAPSGALDVGRSADFFTVNLYDPSIAGATSEVLLDTIVFSLERRAIREVWIGARPRIVSGRHPQQGPIVGRYVELQRRLRSGA